MKRSSTISAIIVSVIVGFAQADPASSTLSPNAERLIAEHPPQSVVIVYKDPLVTIPDHGPICMEHIYGKVKMLFGESMSDFRGTQLAYPTVWVFRDVAPDKCSEMRIENGIAYYQSAAPAPIAFDKNRKTLPPANGLVPIKKIDLAITDQEIAKLFAISEEAPSAVDFFPSHLFLDEPKESKGKSADEAAAK